MDASVITSELLERSLPMSDYIRDYRDAERVGSYCRQCSNYARHWGCPPYTHDLDAQLSAYSRATLLCLKLSFAERLPLSEAYRLLQPERLRLEALVREKEERGGRAFGLAGMCPYCKEGCTRAEGLPCRHPDLVRSSLEAYGFDVARTAERLFGIPLLWSTDGLTPDYLTFIVGYFE